MSLKRKKRFRFYLVYGITYLHALLPLRILYIFSDILYLLAYKIIGYRKEVVRKNLRNSFPEKSEKELLAIEKKFYKHLGDYYVETIKALHISEQVIRKRMVFKNPEIINDFIARGKSCFLSLGHYANWEWVMLIGKYIVPGTKISGIYKRLSSDAFNELFLRIRSSFEPSTPIEKKQVYRTIISYHNDKKPLLMGFIADQRPSQNSDEYWTTFLNQDTIMVTGMEKIASRFSISVFYIDIKRIKRGYYEGTISLITEDASKEEPFAVTEKFANKLEETIKRDPAYYLWSHKRWSFQRIKKEERVEG